jgi:uncharacterized protein involved in outer membrane biogenesis
MSSRLGLADAKGGFLREVASTGCIDGNAARGVWTRAFFAAACYILTVATTGAPKWGQRGRAALALASALLVIAAIVAGGAYYVVRSMLAPAWIRAHIIPPLETRYGRRITFEDFRLRPRGLILGGVRVSEDPSFDLDGVPFLFVDHVVVRFDPLGLLRRTFLLDFIRFVRPEIHLYENENGQWSAASLFATAAQPAPRMSEPAATLASRFRLVVTRVELDDASVRVRRAPAANSGETRDLGAKSLDAAVLFHPMTGFLDYEARGEIVLPAASETDTAKLTAFGVLDLSIPRVELQISTENLDADALRAFWSDPNRESPALRLDELVQADIDHDILFVAKDLRVGTIDVSALRLEAGATKRAIELRKLDIGVFDGTLHVDGNVDLTTSPVTLGLAATLRALDVRAMASALAGPGLARTLEGQLSGTLAVAGPWAPGLPLKPGVAKASLDLTLERFDGPALAQAWQEREGKGDTTPQSALDFRSVTVDLTAAAKTATLGTVTLDKPAVRAKVDSGELEIVELSGAAFGGKVLASGSVDLREKIPPWHAQVAIEQARFEDFVPTSPRFDWARTTGTVDLELEGAGSGLTLEAFRDALAKAAESGNDRAFVKGNAKIAVRALDLDRLGKPPRERDELGPYTLGNVTIDAHLDVDRLRLWKLDYANAKADARLERDQIRVERIVGGIADGELDLSGNVDLALKGLAYRGQGAFKQVETSTFVDAYLPPQMGHVSGRGSAAFEFSLSGTKKDSALDSLAVDGYIALHSGQVKESRLFESIAKSTGIDEFKELQLTRCGGDIHIADRRVSTDQLVLGGTDARVLLVGGVGFNSTVKAEVWLGFSPTTQRNIFSRGILLPYVTDAKGWTYVPFVTTGTLKEPEITIADEAIRSTAIRAIPDATERIVRESSKLVPGGEAIVGGSIDAVKSILSGLGRVLQANSARAKGQVPLDEPVLTTPPQTPPPPPANPAPSSSN